MRQAPDVAGAESRRAADPLRAPRTRPGLDADALDRHTQAWVDRLNRSGAAYLTPALLDGRWMARISIGALQTERSHVEALWADLQRVVGTPA